MTRWWFWLGFGFPSASLRDRTQPPMWDVYLGMRFFTLPNLLSLSRLVGVPFLYVLVQWDDTFWFTALYLALVFTDWLDGFLARRWNQVSDVGSLLDTVADLALYLSTAWFMWVLFPHVIVPNLTGLGVVLGILAATMGISLLKTGSILLLHTHITRSAAVALLATFLLSFHVDTRWGVALVMAMYGIGFLEMVWIFVRYGKVDPDTRSITWLWRKDA